MDYTYLPNTTESVILTDWGTGILSTVAADLTPIPEKYRPTVYPRGWYTFNEAFKPVATMKMAVAQEMAVSAGDFMDVCLGVMNEGNLPISTLDVRMYEVANGKQADAPVETVHINAVNPDSSRLTMSDGSVDMTGQKVACRAEDFSADSGMQDKLLSHQRVVYTADIDTTGNALSGPENVGSDETYIQTPMLMPGTTASFNAVFKIPESWASANSGDTKKTLRFGVSQVSAQSNAAGVQPNAAGEDALITYRLDGRTGRLVLQRPAAANGPVAQAIDSGLIANEIEGSAVDLETDIHDLSVSHRVFTGWDGQDWLDIHAVTGERMKLTCAVYLDGIDEPHYVNLPYYERAMTNNRTHVISLPVSALVKDPDAHRQARVVILSPGTGERAYANNEFTIWLNGSDPLRFVRQPEDVTAQEGERVAFEVEAAGGNKPYAYQWQAWDPRHERWVDLPGFTGATLRRDDIEKQWDGTRFRCVVTDAEGTRIISREVTLTVRDSVDTGDHSHLPLYAATALAALALLWWLRRRSA